MTARVKAIIKPELLLWARTSAGLDQYEAAHRLKINEHRLVAWENGDDAPSIPQLRNLAAVYKRPLAVFYLQNVPVDFQVLRDLRRLPGVGLRYFPSSLQIEIRRASQNRELALELLEALDEQISPCALTTHRNEDPEAIGQRIRMALGVTDAVQAKWSDDRNAFKAWQLRIEQMSWRTSCCASAVYPTLTWMPPDHRRIKLLKCSAIKSRQQP